MPVRPWVIAIVNPLVVGVITYQLIDLRQVFAVGVICGVAALAELQGQIGIAVEEEEFGAPIVKTVTHEIKREFRLKWYDWAVKDFEREIAQGYPFLRYCRNTHSIFALQLFTRMNNAELRDLVRCLVKRFSLPRIGPEFELTDDEQKPISWYLDEFRKSRWTRSAMEANWRDVKGAQKLSTKMFEDAGVIARM